MSIYLGDDTDENSDEDLARYSVAWDPDIQRLRGQINDISQNCWPIMAIVLDKIAGIKLGIKGIDFKPHSSEEQDNLIE